jgi:hypothetical protein
MRVGHHSVDENGPRPGAKSPQSFPQPVDESFAETIDRVGGRQPDLLQMRLV